MGIVYKVTNLVNNKVYIGQTWRKLEQRISSHLKNNHCSYFHNALIKYGKDNFKWEIIFISNSQEELDKKEILLIKEHKSQNKKHGYNLRSGGSRGKFNLSSKKKMKESALKYFNSNEARLKHSEIQKKRFSNLIEKEKLSLAHGGKSFYIKKDNVIILFKNQSEAARFIGCAQTYVGLGLRKNLLVKGWKIYYEDTNS
jgi:group I intron endonuclease